MSSESGVSSDDNEPPLIGEGYAQGASISQDQRALRLSPDQSSNSLDCNETYPTTSPKTAHQPSWSSKKSELSRLIVVDNPAAWPHSIGGVEVIDARSYLRCEHPLAQSREARVFNFCSSYRYQGFGYYVSLLAAARGHRPLPSIATIQDMKSEALVNLASDELDELIQKGLAHIRSEKFTLSVYFGKNVASRYDRLCAHLFSLFEVPFMRAEFVFDEQWTLQSLRPIATNEIPDDHQLFVREVATEYFFGRRQRVKRKSPPRYNLAILYNANDPTSPSDEKAIEKYCAAAEDIGLGVEIISKEDYSRIPEFDALFIRETTAVDDHTYLFSRRAQAEGLVVIDDPESILKCTNKVYLAELLAHHHLPTPKTVVVDSGNASELLTQLKLPIVLKEPDSSSSLGVVKVETGEQCRLELERMLKESELVIAQSFVPTEFDWRIGVLDREPIFACKYFMAKNHWQIINWKAKDAGREGRGKTLPVELVPSKIVRTAVKAANLIGSGFYGVDIKQYGKEICVIEVNDNPNTDSGWEDAIIKDQLYSRIMKVFLQRIELRKAPIALPL